MSLDRDMSIIAQNAGGTAATLYASLVASGFVQNGFDADLYTEIRREVFNGTLALAGATAVVAGVEDRAPVPAYAGNTGADANGPGGLDFRTGKHRGQTIAQVYSDDPDYLEWASANLRNDFMRGKINDFLREQS
jgi:hypothetical protein